MRIVMGLMLFIIFTNYSEVRVETNLIKLVDDTKLGGVVDI